MIILGRLKKLLGVLVEWLKMVFYKRGLLRDIYGLDKIYLISQGRNMGLAKFESDWWKRLMQEVKLGDTVVDVGAYIGVFSVLLAKKVGDRGKVISFEPNPGSLALLKKNLLLNGVSGHVQVIPDAIGNSNHQVSFMPRDEESCVAVSAAIKSKGSIAVQEKTLDEVLDNRKVDILKIDVEGYEYNVLLGAKSLLSRKEGSPRFIFFELHPYAWKDYGADLEKIRSIFQSAGYIIEVPELTYGVKLEDIEHNWVIFATKC